MKRQTSWWASETGRPKMVSRHRAGARVGNILTASVWLLVQLRNTTGTRCY